MFTSIDTRGQAHAWRPAAAQRHQGLRSGEVLEHAPLGPAEREEHKKCDRAPYLLGVSFSGDGAP